MHLRYETQHEPGKVDCVVIGSMVQSAGYQATKNLVYDWRKADDA